MNQTSDKFFDEMLKDNMPVEPQGNFQEQLADMIDQRIEASMQKFTEQFSQIKPAVDTAAENATKRDETRPTEPETPETEVSDN